MNNIYKVIWSKAKNCYVVASEIARSHTKSASGSEKIGGGTRRKLLASLMALSLLCGGLGVAEAAVVHVDEVPGGTKAVYTTDETYNRTEVDLALAAKGAAADVASNKTDIAILKTAVGDAGSGLTKEVADQKADIATNRANINNLDGKLANLTTTVSGKADEAAVTTALGDKANTDLSNLTADGVNKIKNTMSADMDLKANKTYVDNALANKADTGTVTALDGRVGGVEGKVTTLETKVGDASHGLVKDVNDLKNQVNTELGTKANQSDLVAATNRITANEGNITALQKKTAKLSDDGMKLTGMTAVGGATVSGTTVNARALKVTGQISDGTVNTTLAKIDASMTQTAANKDAIDTLQTITNGQADAIKDLKDRTTNISYDSGKRSTSINGIDIGDTQVDMNGKNLTDVGTINGIDLGTKQKGNYISQDGSIWGNMLEVDDQVKTNADAIAKETADRKAAIGELAVDGKYIKKGMNVSDNLVELDKQAKINADNIQTNANNIKNNKDEIARVNGELVKTNDYFNKELGKTNDYFNTELGKTNAALQEEGKARAEADAKINTKIGNIDDTRTEYVKNANSISQNLTTLDEKLQATNDRTGGIKRNTEDTQTTIEDKVTVNSSGDVGGVKGLSAETINTTGDAAIGGKLNVTGASDLKGDVTLGTPNGTNTVTVNGTAHFNEAANMNKGLNVTSGDTDLKNTTVDGTLSVNKETTLNGKLTANDEATFTKKVTMENDLEVKGELKTDKIAMENKKTDADGTRYNSSTTITADGITHNGEVKKSGVTTESQFTHTEEGSETYAKKGDATDWTETRSDVKADGVTTEVKDSKGNRTNTSQTASENKTYLEDKDSKNTNSTIDTAKGYDKTIKGENGETSTKQDELNITNTAQKGTITNDAKDIVNNATGNLTTTVGGNELHEVTGTKTENVTGMVKENYSNGQETNVTGNQDIHVTGKQTNKIDGDQENTIGGDQTTTVTGDISNKAENITNEANTMLTDQVGDNTRVTTSTSITDTVGTANRKIENGKIIDTANDSTVTTENGKGTTFTKTGSTAYSTAAGAPTDTNIAGNHITTGRVDANELGVSDKDGDNTADFSVKAGEGVKASAGDGKTTGSLDVTAGEVGSSVKDASGKGSTFKQRIDAIMGNVKTDAGESDVTQKGDEITSKVGIGEATNSKVTQKKDLLETAVTDGTNYNISDDTASASAKLLTDGTKMNKQQDNLDSSVKTITNGTYSTSTVQSALDITHTAKDGTITHDAKDIVNNASNSITDKVGTNTRVLDNDGITDTVGGSTFKQRIDKIMMESKEVSIKAEETLTNEAKVITNKASEVINNEAIDINNTATGIINSKASEIKNQADKLISNKVGENTSEYMEDGKITTSVKDGAKSTVTIQNADGLQAAVTNGTSTNASATTATSSAQTIASGNKANSVITTIDGTQFVNTDAAVPVTGASGAGTAVNTTIKGNTITTGKVTMDYADVMKDLGVRGNANINGKTTTGSLEVKGESKLTGDVTMENNATVGNNLTVNGTTKTKTLNVTENAEVGGTLKVAKKATFEDSVAIAKDLTVGGDVTAKSYKVGDKTYISADGINANDQKITNVADGSISEGSKDAVNGGQLYGMKTDLEHKVDKVGANAAAMANLHPMEFDPDSKWNIAAAMGNYGSETATAIGAFYRPNEDVMVNFSTAFGTGENMVGGGVSVRLGKGSNKLSREESNALKAQVNDLTARMDALLSVLNPNMSKDFPDVPENHWAYEAVSRLAGNDIVQGYPDGEFHGERTMTRYEMAEIIYNALSRGAEAEKELVEEFKPELQAMAASEKATAERAEG